MIAEEFEKIIDELVKGMTTLHNRLLRIEAWMLKIQEKNNEKRIKIAR